MCGRYYIEQDAENEMLADYIRQAQERADRQGLSMVSAGEIRPTNIVPVIAPAARNREPSAFPMQWGFQHPTRGMLVFNTRSETAADKPLFCTSIQDRRCAVPASGYYEWAKQADGRKIKYAFFSKDHEPLYLAGLYLRSSQALLPRFSILTRDATSEIKSIHARTPVVFPQHMLTKWLSADSKYASIADSPVLDIEYHALSSCESL